MPVDFPSLHELPRAELLKAASEVGLTNTSQMRQVDLVFEVGKLQGKNENSSYGRGVLEVHTEGFGFLRSAADNFLPGQDDIYVSQSQIRRFKLQTGDTVIGLVRPPKEGERYLALLRVESVNGEPPGADPPSFDTLTAIYPDDRVPMESDEILKIVDLVAPMGLGQRGILVTPGRTNQIGLLRRFADTMSEDDDLHVTVLLLGERPEEIGEWRKHSKAEIIATPFDASTERHTQVADIVFERARRMVERGDDAVLLVDNLSRLLRFCLTETPAAKKDNDSNKANALHRIRRYLGAARALEEGGSLTVIGVLSQNDDDNISRALLNDLRDVVNWELTLSSDLATQGMLPPIVVHRSGTLREERLLTDSEITTRTALRSTYTGDVVEDLQKLIAAAKA